MNSQKKKFKRLLNKHTDILLPQYRKNKSKLYQNIFKK
jgi:hypothetical protein